MKRRILTYLCPECGRKFEVDVRTEVYERRALYCACNGSLMHCTLEARDARDKTKRVKGG